MKLPEPFHAHSHFIKVPCVAVVHVLNVPCQLIARPGINIQRIVTDSGSLQNLIVLEFKGPVNQPVRPDSGHSHDVPYTIDAEHE